MIKVMEKQQICIELVNATDIWSVSGGVGGLPPTGVPIESMPGRSLVEPIIERLNNPFNGMITVPRLPYHPIRLTRPA